MNEVFDFLHDSNSYYRHLKLVNLYLRKYNLTYKAKKCYLQNVNRSKNSTNQYKTTSY